jgi:hypothetical protein
MLVREGLQHLVNGGLNFDYSPLLVLCRTAWEDILRDNLLNFASSAKGLLLLQQTGAMNECVSYMYARYEKKLQVITCSEKSPGNNMFRRQ